LHARQTSVVSMHTAHEMYDIVDLLGAAIDAPMDRPRHERAQSEDLKEAIPDPSVHSPISDDENDVDRTQGSIMSSSRSRVSYSSSYSYSQPSEYELVTADGEVERVYLPPSPTFPGFHLPRSRTSALSDTPSLTSSRSSVSSQLLPPTPGLISPAEYGDSHLPIIVEKQSENSEWERSSISGHEGMPTLRISPPDTLVDAWPKKKSTLQWKMLESPREDEIAEEPLHTDSPSPLTPSASDGFSSPMSPLSPKTPISPMTPLSPTSSAKISSLARFMKKDKGTRDSISSQVSQLPLDSKALKAEEKRRRKEEAKARTERLAEQLKARAKERAREADTSSVSTERKKKDPAAMYGGIAGVVM